MQAPKNSPQHNYFNKQAKKSAPWSGTAEGLYTVWGPIWAGLLLDIILFQSYSLLYACTDKESESKLYQYSMHTIAYTIGKRCVEF